MYSDGFITGVHVYQIITKTYAKKYFKHQRNNLADAYLCVKLRNVQATQRLRNVMLTRMNKYIKDWEQ